MPRSRYTQSAATPSSASSSSASAKSMRRKRVWQTASRANSSKRSSAAGSRSMHTSVPVGPMRSATRRAWPPSPNVQSTAISPGCGSTRSISSPASTGMCVRVMSRRMAKALSDLDDLVAQFPLVGDPLVAIPHLEVIEVPHDHDLLRDGAVVQKRLIQSHAAGGVELGVEGAAREESRELPALGAEGPEPAQEALRPLLEPIGRPDRHAGLQRLRQNHSTGERRAELGWDVQSLLGVERVVEVPAEGQGCLRDRPSSGAVGNGPEWRGGRSRATPVL